MSEDLVRAALSELQRVEPCIHQEKSVVVTQVVTIGGITPVLQIVCSGCGLVQYFSLNVLDARLRKRTGKGLQEVVVPPDVAVAVRDALGHLKASLEASGDDADMRMKVTQAIERLEAYAARPGG